MNLFFHCCQDESAKNIPTVGVCLHAGVCMCLRLNFQSQPYTQSTNIIAPLLAIPAMPSEAFFFSVFLDCALILHKIFVRIHIGKMEAL